MVSAKSRFSFMGAGSDILRYKAGDPETMFSQLDRALQGIQVQSPALPFQFTGGYIGYLGYELKGDCGASNKHRSGLPDAYLLKVDRFLAIDHVENTLWLVSCGEPDQELEGRIAALKDCPPAALLSAPVEFKLAMEREEYLRLIATCQARIAAGESYEICLTNQLRVTTDIGPLAYYETLRRLNPAPHSAFLHLDDIDVACSSPERFLHIDAARNVESR